MKYYKLTDPLNHNEVVMEDGGKSYTYRFGQEQWVRSAIMVRYNWPGDSCYEKYVEISPEEAQQLLNTQRKRHEQLLQLAIQTAAQAHADQKDKGGAPYLGHLQAVADAQLSLEAKIVAYLHDICEDTPTTPEDLLQLGFPPRIVRSVEVLTKTAGIPYEDYLKAVNRNSNARSVKIADLKHNMDLSRIPAPTDRDLERIAKYQRSLDFLEGRV